MVGACVAAAYCDVRTHRIPNALSAALCIGGAVAAACQGPSAFLAFAAILAVLLFAGTVLHAGGFIGGGDVKLIAVSSAAIGAHEAVPFLIATVLSGGVLALIVATRHGQLRRTIVNVGALALPLIAGVPPARISDGTKMPYALAILAGALFVTLSHLST